MKVLLTGGAGYIGAHVLDELVLRGHSVDVIDSLDNIENMEFVQNRAEFFWPYRCQLINNFVAAKYRYDAVIHLAACISVEESTRKAHEYWQNNLTALMALEHIQTDHLIFASTGTAFNPTNPYAASKVACEQYVQGVAASEHPWFDGQTTFRFYNVSGLKKGIRPTGQPTHLIRIAAEVAKGKRPELAIFGIDYPTRDGTAIRDYIHVEDVAASIVNAVEVGPANTPYECLGTGHGTSVIEVVQSMQQVAETALCVRMAPRRAGDDASTVCPTQYKHIRLSKTLDDMCLSAYENV